MLAIIPLASKNQRAIPDDRLIWYPFVAALHSTMHVLPSLAVATCLCLYYVIARFLGVRHDPREPPSLPQRVPVIGHVIGMLREKGRYYVQLR